MQIYERPMSSAASDRIIGFGANDVVQQSAHFGIKRCETVFDHAPYGSVRDDRITVHQNVSESDDLP